MPELGIVVVGSGLSGLTAAFALKRAGMTVRLLDAARPAGGVIRTERPAPGWIVEGGPDGFLASDPDVPRLAAELGLGDRIIGQTARSSLVWDGRELAPLATGDAAALLAIDARDLDLSAGFATLAHGMSELVDALAAEVPPEHATVKRVAAGARGARVTLDNGLEVPCAAAVLAVPAYVASELLASLDHDVAAALARIVYHPSVNVSLAYRRDQVNHALQASGFATAPATESPVRACTFASSKFAGRAPDGFALLRAFVTPSEPKPAAAAHRALAAILGIAGDPLWSRTYAWPRGIPRYAPGHAELVAGLRERLGRFGGLVLAGAGYDGAGVSACIRSGLAAARRVLDRS
jgi:oxygen-dependent protoporphyrinogen oxidase